MLVVGGVLERGRDRGGTCGRTLLHHSGQRMEQQKKVKNKIHPGLRRPPTNKSHTTINKKHAGATKEGQERRFDRHGAWGGRNLIVLGTIKLGRGVKN
jgi:hypothetical protein